MTAPGRGHFVSGGNGARRPATRRAPWGSSSRRGVLNYPRGGDAERGESAVRHATVLLILIGALGLSAPSFARDITLHKISAEEMKAACDKAGGRFSQDPSGYGCATNCKGGAGSDCIVTCKTGKSCIAQVIGARRPQNVEQALTKPARHKR